ncbi:MAG: monovalent cation/H+ antiporter subunit D family protein [Planctomycetota bacterium]|nr:monovalent cation/H+ antiporter subunit D family protein [Planctomycetota bacterium]
MLDHLPVLPIIVPLIAAPLCVLVRQRRMSLGIALVVSWATFALTATLLVTVLDKGEQVYALGGWVAPWGIEYRVDALSAFVLLFVSGIGATVLSFAPLSVDREVPRDLHYLFYTEYLLCLTGLLGIVITGDMFNVFVFLEISSLSAYAMISLGKSRRALTATFQYLVMGTIGATFILIGIGLMYMMTGTLNMADMAVRLQQTTEINGTSRLVIETRTILVAFAFLSVGISLKMALFPLHMWLPNAYTYAPSAVTAFIAATATKVSVYVLLRFVFTIFGTSFAFTKLPLDTGLMVLSLIGIVAASTAAIFQTNVKRLLAYSSIAQVGYMVLGISFASVSGLTGGISHMFNHALIKGGLFLATGCLAYRLGSLRVDDLRGIGRRMPVTMFAWVVGGLGLIGVPVTAGFISKWYLMSAALERGWWPVALLVLLSSLLAVIYVWRVVEVAYFEEPLEEHATVKEAPVAMLIPTCLLIGATVVFGIWTDWSAGVAQAAASLLLGGTP